MYKLAAARATTILIAAHATILAVTALGYWIFPTTPPDGTFEGSVLMTLAVLVARGK